MMLSWNSKRHSISSWCTLLSLSACLDTVLSQTLSTNTPIPPLQWINLSGLVSTTSAAPPLKDASIGYDDTSRTLIIFGGESQQGIPQSQTYLLNLDTLEWSNLPNPPLGVSGTPSARSAAISGDDFAASNRKAHIVIGGKGEDGSPLSDIWEFDYISQFWAPVTIRPSTGPSARYGAVGGNDIRTPFITDPLLPGPNNSFYLAGGFDGQNILPLSDVWRLNISGTLSSNNPQSVVGSWEQVNIPNALASQTSLGGAVVYQAPQNYIVASGGCSSVPTANNFSCANGGSYLLNTNAHTSSSIAPCPAPRFGPALAVNANGASSNFAEQVFVLLGTFNSSLWDDGGGLSKGEVDVIDARTGSWTRILPAGDPGTNGGTPAFPSPREGAAALSFSQALVGLTGTARATVSDTIVFGGRDEAGNYLSELWILRAYSGTLTASNQHWSGFGSGQLTGGIQANGQGVTVQYLAQCAVAKQPVSSGTSSSSSSGSGSSPTGSSPANPTQTSPIASIPPFDTSVVHKVLAPVSIALALPAVVLYRLSFPSGAVPDAQQLGSLYLSLTVGLVSFGLGLGGFISSFVSIIRNSSLTKRAVDPLHLQTSHGQAGVAFFAGFYVLVPVLFGIAIYLRWKSRPDPVAEGHKRANSTDTAEKLALYTNRAGSPTNSPLAPMFNANGTSDETPPTPADPRPRVRSWHNLSLSPFPAQPSARRSSESGLDATSPPSTVRSFEVTNRPRVRQPSAHSLAAFSDVGPPAQPPRNLSDMSWLERRRSLNTVGDIDYVLSQLHRRNRNNSTPGTTGLESTRGLMGQSTLPPPPQMPPPFQAVIHVLLHAFLLGLCILALSALWLRGPKAAFGVFLGWTVMFYSILFTLSWRGIPREPLSDIGLESIPFPSDSRSPYQHHQPPFRAAGDYEGYPTSSQGGHGTLEVDDDDDVDEETRQLRIEEEMNRRDVSIVTVPKRKLFLTNPEVLPPSQL
ncbi:hypothetical protein ABKN59_000582 [Abortiporus biennis]